MKLIVYICETIKQLYVNEGEKRELEGVKRGGELELDGLNFQNNILIKFQGVNF